MSKKFSVCPICKKKFIKKKTNQRLCSTKCYRIHYKTSRKESEYPFFICPDCNTKTSLDFLPNRKRLMWSEFMCPKCGFLANTSEERELHPS